MKSDTPRIGNRHELLDTLKMMAQPSSSPSFAPTKKISTSRKMLSRRQPIGRARLPQELPKQYLSQSMEKSFLRMKKRASARHAYLEAEIITNLAHQIRSMRMDRKLTQRQLADLLGTTQTVISRLEDPSYGRYSLKTLIDLAKVFDTGMQVRFVSFVTMLQETFKPSITARHVCSFEEEASSVAFYRTNKTPITNLKLFHSENPSLLKSTFVQTKIIERESVKVEL